MKSEHLAIGFSKAWATVTIDESPFQWSDRKSDWHKLTLRISFKGFCLRSGKIIA